MKTGKYIEPPKNAQFDPQTGTFIVPKEHGQFDPKTGTFLPPPPEEMREPGSEGIAHKGPDFFGGGIHLPPPPGEGEGGELPPPPPPGEHDGGIHGPDLADFDLGDIDPCAGGDISNCQNFQNPTGTEEQNFNVTKVKFQVVVED